MINPNKCMYPTHRDDGRSQSAIVRSHDEQSGCISKLPKLRTFVLSFLLLILCFSAAFDANARCEECAFPMLKVSGKWQAADDDMEYMILDSKAGAPIGMVRVTVILRRVSTGVIVARGKVMHPIEEPKLTITLQTRTGELIPMAFWFDADRGKLLFEVSCEERGPQMVFVGRCRLPEPPSTVGTWQNQLPTATSEFPLFQ